MSRVIRSTLLSLLLLISMATYTEVRSLDIDFDKQRVVDVIALYELQGFSFLYSSDLVSKHLRFSHNPIGILETERLSSALREFNLALKPGLRSKQWLIVRSAEEYHWARGKVVEKGLAQPIPEVKVRTERHHTFTDRQGVFSLLVSHQDKTLYISHSDYQSEEITLNKPVEAPHIIYLDYDKTEEVVINASWYSLRGVDHVSTYDLLGEEIKNMPVMGSDALRAIAYLPGTSSNGLSAQSHIRGGLRDETLVLFNEIELLEPFHLKDFQSLFSGLNPSLIESVDIYTGGFPVRYGDKMSGVVDIIPVDEVPNSGGELYASFLSSGVAAYGGLANTGGHWFVSARRGNLDVVENYVDSLNGDPSYSDAFAQVIYPLSSSMILDLGVLAYNDDVVIDNMEVLLDSPQVMEGEYAKSRYRNTYGWLQLEKETSNSFFSTTLSQGAIRHRRVGVIEEEDESPDFLNDYRDFRITALSSFYRIKYSEKLEFEFGGKWVLSDSEYRFSSELERGDLAELLALPLEVESSESLEFEGSHGGLYSSIKYGISERLSLDFGLRWDYQDIERRKYEDQFSPRLSGLFQTENAHIRFSFGRFHQPEGINELQIADGITEFQKAQYTDSFILGLDQNYVKWHSNIRLETFHKQIKHPKFRYENIFNSLELVPELMDDRILVAPDKAEISGVELTFSYEPSTDFYAWMSMTKSKAEDYIDGTWRPRTWEQNQTLTSGLIWKSNAWRVSSVLRWHSGWRTTQLPDNLDELELQRINYNESELPDFFSFDVKVSREWVWGSHLLLCFLEVTNLTNHKNIGGIEYDIEENDGESYMLIPEGEPLLSVIPSLGFELKFYAK